MIVESDVLPLLDWLTVVDVGVLLMPERVADGPPFVGVVVAVPSDVLGGEPRLLALRLSQPLTLELHTGLALYGNLPWRGAFG